MLPPARNRGIAELRRALLAGETTARELAEQSLAAIVDSATTLNAFRSIRTEEAWANADEALVRSSSVRPPHQSSCSGQ